MPGLAAQRLSLNCHLSKHCRCNLSLSLSLYNCIVSQLRIIIGISQKFTSSLWFLRKCGDIPPGKTKWLSTLDPWPFITLTKDIKIWKIQVEQSVTKSILPVFVFLFPPVTASNYAAINCPLLWHIWIWCWQQVSSLSLYLKCFSQTLQNCDCRYLTLITGHRAGIPLWWCWLTLLQNISEVQLWKIHVLGHFKVGLLHQTLISEQFIHFFPIVLWRTLTIVHLRLLMPLTLNSLQLLNELKIKSTVLMFALRLGFILISWRKLNKTEGPLTGCQST